MDTYAGDRGAMVYEYLTQAPVRELILRCTSPEQERTLVRTQQMIQGILDCRVGPHEMHPMK